MRMVRKGVIKMIRVWFNHWFSTSYWLIELMKKDLEEQIYVIGSNRQRDSVIQKVCDEWYEDSAAEGDAYIQDCLDFCIQHAVDVFVPRHKMVEIGKQRSRFEAIGVKVLLDAYETIHLLNDKAATYHLLEDEEQIPIPEYCVVNTLNQFQMSYHDMRNRYERLCMKFVCDEGGRSFRKIIEEVDKLKRLRCYQGATITYDEVVRILESYETFEDIIIMPYLSENEISVDCLNTAQGLIAIPRVKQAARHEQIVYDEAILSMTKTIIDKTNLQFPCNIQYRMEKGIPYLLEVNTRMSGGLQLSCLASGVNIPNIALNKLLGKTVSWKLDKTQKVVSYIEMPQMIR